MGRLPLGRRGLKCSAASCAGLMVWSPPTREAWIEIQTLLGNDPRAASPPTREAWIEIDC